MAAAEDIVLFPVTPWSLRLFAGTRVSPFWIGLAISAAWFAIYLLYTALLCEGPGRQAALGGTTWPSELGWSLLIGMAPAVTAASLRGSQRDLEDLAPLLCRDPADLEGLRREISTVPRTLMTTVSVGGAILTAIFLAGFQTETVWVAAERPSLTNPDFLWYIGRNVINWWLISRAIVIEISLARAFSRLGTRLPPLDVVDRKPLAAFGRRGLRSVLLWMLYVSLFSVQYALGTAEPALGVAALVIVAYAIAAFLLPVWGAHLRLREARSNELALVREQMTEARKRVLDANVGEMGGGRLADLVAWEQRVGGASEWPFGSSTVLRVGLYTAIGLGSWLGAAFVERLLATALGG